MTDNVIVEKSMDFAVRIVNLCKLLQYRNKEYTLTKQLLRSGTSIGANISEAQRGQSRADFYAKMVIALKEANETQYWIHLLYRTNYLSKKEYNSIETDIEEILRLLTSICKSVNTI